MRRLGKERGGKKGGGVLAVVLVDRIRWALVG